MEKSIAKLEDFKEVLKNPFTSKNGQIIHLTKIEKCENKKNIRTWNDEILQEPAYKHIRARIENLCGLPHQWLTIMEGADWVSKRRLVALARGALYPQILIDASIKYLDKNPKVGRRWNGKLRQTEYRYYSDIPEDDVEKIDRAVKFFDSL